MAITIKHAKTDSIVDWTQTDLDAQIALGNFPAGTTLANIVLPSDWNNDHTLSGTVPITNGGTGQTTANAAINALLPSQTSQSGKVLSTNGTDTSWIAAGGTGTVTSVTGTAPVSVATGTTTPVISMAAATGSVNGYLTSTDWTTFNSKAPATSGTSILYGNGSGGFSNVTVGSGLSFSTGTLSATGGSMVYPGAGIPNSTGSAWGTSYGTTGANSVVLRDTNQNVTVNCLFEGFTSQAAGTLITLTASSVQNWVITGSGGQTIKLPDATTLPSGALFTFNNNQSSGTIVIQNNSSTTIATLQSGAFSTIVLLSNSTAAGSWDRHDQAPSNVSWSTNTLDYAGSITSATWNGTAIALNRGGTNANLTAVNGGAVYSTGSALAITAAGTSGQVLTSSGAGAPTWTTPTTGTVTSVTGTAPVVSSGGATPAISMAAASSTVNGYLTSTDWTTFNSKGSGTVTSASVVSANGFAGTVATATTTPAITISTSITGLLKGNGTAISAATSGTDYAPATSGSSILYGDGSGGFSNVTIGSGLSFSTGTLSASGSSGVTSFQTSLSGLTPSTASTGVVTLAGTLGISSGGTGQATATAAFNALAPSQTSNTGKFLKTDGTNTSWSALPSSLLVLLHSGSSTTSVSVANGVLPILNHAGSTINVAVT